MDDRQTLLSPDLVHRLAAIDIGTNSVRLIVAEPLRDGSYRILDEEKESARLGASLSQTGRLDPAAIEKALAALRRMQQIAQGFAAAQIRTIATCAVREAANGDEFCRRARTELGLEIEVISGEQEALLAFFSVQRAFDLGERNVAVVDIGGGSTEVVLAHGNLVEAIYTTQLGAVRLAETFGGAGGLVGEDYERMVAAVDRHLRKHTRKPIFVPQMLYGSGGTFTSLASMAMAAKGQGGLPTRGYQVTRAEVRHLLDRLRKLPIKERTAFPGLAPDRADIIVPGLAIVDRVMGRLRTNVVQVHNRGVRDGLLLTMIDQSLGGTSSNPLDRDAAITRLVERSGGDLAHGRQVARLAGLIYLQLAATCDFDPADRALLEAAARLQDVGYLIDYEQHHLHSYHLIVNSRLAGFQPHELQMVALVARYHRGEKPQRRHGRFRRLAAEDRRRVRRLAGILRIAGGLDRSNHQLVHGVRLQWKRRKLVLHVQAPAYPEVDIWCARQRVGLLEKALGRPIAIEWELPAASAPAGAAPATNGQPQPDVPVPPAAASESPPRN